MILTAGLFYDIFNFCIFFGILFFLLKTPVIQFFHSRRERMRRHIADSAKALSKAKKRYALATDARSKLASAISERAAAIESMCERECEEIMALAKKRSEHILTSAKRFVEDEKRRAKKSVELSVLRCSLRKAREELATRMKDNFAARTAMDKTLDSLGGAAKGVSHE
jgi:F-type H+-transporting ATPase subunit b